jgi:hypothetical protein
VILEDGAPAHRYQFKQTIYKIKGVQKIMNWQGTPLILMLLSQPRHGSTAYNFSNGTPAIRRQGRGHGWNELRQEHIHQWIERLIHHIQVIIDQKEAMNIRKAEKRKG